MGPAWTGLSCIRAAAPRLSTAHASHAGSSSLLGRGALCFWGVCIGVLGNRAGLCKQLCALAHALWGGFIAADSHGTAAARQSSSASPMAILLMIAHLPACLSCSIVNTIYCQNAKSSPNSDMLSTWGVVRAVVWAASTVACRDADSKRQHGHLCVVPRLFAPSCVLMSVSLSLSFPHRCALAVVLGPTPHIP